MSWRERVLGIMSLYLLTSKGIDPHPQYTCITSIRIKHMYLALKPKEAKREILCNEDYKVVQSM